MGALFLLKCIINLKVYKKSSTDIVQTIMYFNLLVFAAFSLFHFRTDPTKQSAIAYTSTIITFLLLVGVIAYHIYLLIRKEKTTVELDEYPLVAEEPVIASAKVTYSVVEVHQPQREPDSDKSGNINPT